ncbi:MAG: LysE family translocator [Rhodobacteraceae bacterium]|nr:LysE family translocator [Paracoccaceae bacterium]
MTFWVLFCFTVFVASMIPGPSTLIAFTHGARLGWVKVIATASGNALATILQAIAACAGLGLALAKSATLFLLIKYLGAAYLIFMGISMWRRASQGVDLKSELVSDVAVFQRLFSSGFLVAASNPKAIIFFTALFPQFLGAAETAYSQMALMIMLAGVIAFSVAMIYAALGSRLRAMSITQSAMTWVQKITGGLFVSGGVGLAVSRS